MIAALLCALPLLVGDVPRVLVLEPKTDAAHVDEAQALQRVLVQELTHVDGVGVVGTDDLAQIAEVGAGKLAYGCDADACLAEIGDAIGANLIVFSELGVLGDRQLWQLRLWDQTRGEIVARHTVEGRDIGALRAGVPAAVDVLGGPLRSTTIRYERRDGISPLFVAGVSTLAVGALTTVVGAGGLVVGAIVVGNRDYDTDLRRGLQEHGGTLLLVTGVGIGVAAVGGVLLVVDALGE